MEARFDAPLINRGIMDEDDDLGTPSSSSSTDSANSNDSSSSELTEDATSPESPPSQDQRCRQVGAPYEMASLMAQLPFKRGLSKHFEGKSQSFTSLSNVRYADDLAKRNRPYRKRLKPCKSYATGLDSHKPHSPSKAISKRPSRGALPSLIVKRPSLLGGGGRPPVVVPAHRSSGFSTHQTLLFA